MNQKNLNKQDFYRILSFILFLVASSFPNMAFSQKDSLVATKSKIRNSTLRLSLSGTFTAQHNWHEENNKSIAFLFNGDYNYRIASDKLKQQYYFRSAVGYMKIIDSIWIKNNDYWRIGSIFIENQNKKLNHTYSLQAKSQFLNTIKYEYNEQTDQREKIVRARFFSPATIALSYGLSWSFWDFNYINFNFAAINFSTKPRLNDQIRENDHELAKTQRMYMYADYGMNIQTNISKDINENVKWENFTYVFLNGINKSQVNFDFLNSVTFKFLKYAQFRMDTHVLYDPLFSTRLQYQQDFTIGFMLERRKKRVLN